MKAVSMGAGGFQGGRLRQRWSAAGDEPATSSPPSGADTRHVGEFERVGSDLNDRSVALIRAPRVDWMDDPR